MIAKGEKLHYLAIKKLSTLLREIRSNTNGDFHCLNCLHPFRTKSKLESHKKVCENKDFCNVTMLSEDTQVLKFNKYQKSYNQKSKAAFIIYAALDSIIEA